MTEKGSRRICHPALDAGSRGIMYYVYILASKRNGTLYVGMSSNLIKRVWEHKSDVVRGFTNKYSIHTLVYFETFNEVKEAIKREKQLKKWRRKWKLELIEGTNRAWEDLYQKLL